MVKRLEAEGTYAEKPLQALGYLASGIILLFEPDLITLGTLGVGVPLKGAKAGVKAGSKALVGTEDLGSAAGILRSNKYERLLDEVDAMIDQGKDLSMVDIPKFYRDNGAPELADTYEMRLMANIASGQHTGDRLKILPTSTGAQRQYSQQLDQLHGGLAEIRERIDRQKSVVEGDIKKYQAKYGQPSATDQEKEAVLNLAAGVDDLDRARMKLEQLAAVRGIQFKKLEAEPELRSRQVKARVEEGKVAWERLQASFDEYESLGVRYEQAVDAIAAARVAGQDKKRIKVLRTERDRILTERGVLKEQILADQHLSRGLFADGAMVAALQEVQVLEEGVNAWVIAAARKFDSTAANTLQTSLNEWQAAKIALANATDEATVKSASEAIQKARITFNDTKQKFLDAEVVPLDGGLSSIVTRILRRNKLEAQEQFLDAERMNAVKKANEDLRGSIRAYQSLLKQDPAPVTGDLTGNFLRQGDSPGEAVLDAAGFRAAFKQRYTGPEVENTLARLRRTEEGRVFTRILDGNDARVTVDAATIRRMEDVEKVFQGLVRREPDSWRRSLGNGS